MPRRQLKRAWMVSFAQLRKCNSSSRPPIPDFICLTPESVQRELRLETKKRVMTPADAYQIGSDYIVVDVHYPAEDPVAAYHAIKDEWNQD